MKIIKKKSVLILLFISLLSIAYFFLRSEESITYLAEKVRIADIEVNILADGKMEASNQVDVGAQVSGKIQKMGVELGDKVSKGQLIVEIDDLPQQNALKDADARLKNVISSKVAKEAQLLNAKIGFERQQKLIKSGATTQADYDLAEANLKVYQAELDALDAQVAQAQIALDTAKLDLSYTKITSPIDGTIVARVVQEGQTVNAVQSAPTLVKIADLATMTIKAQISEADVIKVQKGIRAYFTVLGAPDHKYEAVLKQIEPATETFQSTAIGNTPTNAGQAIYYNGLFDIDNHENLFYIDMTTQVYLVTNSVKQVLTIPSMAVRYKPRNHLIPTSAEGNTIVWVLVDEVNHIIEPREVTLGLTNKISTEVISGLKAGEKVITAELSPTEAKAKNMLKPPMR